MKTSIEIAGVAEWHSKLKAMSPAVFTAMVKSAYESFEGVMTTAKEEYVPVDSGALRSTGTVLPPEVSGQSAKITMGFGGPAAPYALSVHENPRAGKTGGISPSGKPYESWARTGGWKYLETPLKAATGEIAAKMKADIDAAHLRLAQGR